MWYAIKTLKSRYAASKTADLTARDGSSDTSTSVVACVRCRHAERGPGREGGAGAPTWWGFPNYVAAAARRAATGNARASTRLASPNMARLHCIFTISVYHTNLNLLIFLKLSDYFWIPTLLNTPGIFPHWILSGVNSQIITTQ